MKYFLCFLLSLSFVTPVFSAGAPEKLARKANADLVFKVQHNKLLNHCLRPTIQLLTPEDGGYGSAFVVRSELVGDKYRNVAITCWHCVEGCQVLMVSVQNYNDNGKLMGFARYPATVYASSKNDDIAVLLFESKDRLKVAKLASFDYELRFGEEVRKIGFGLGDDACMEEGKITGVYTRVPKAFTGYIRCNMQIAVGDSGGPLFNKKDEVIGINNAYRASHGVPYMNRSYYLPITWLKRFDDKVNNALAFVYNHKEKLPVMAYTVLRLKYYEQAGVKNALVCPAYWLEEDE